MAVDDVTVLNTDGDLLASGEDAASAAPGRMATIENAVSREIQENVRNTLAPYLGVDNFQISVAARLNTDKRQTTETIFDPESRVERSTRVIREEEESQNSVSRAQTSIDQNLPEEQAEADTGEQSTAQNDRREEITNYELSSKTITTESDGYAFEHLSIAVLVNRARLAETVGDGATDEAIDARLAEIQMLVASAAGLEEARGDRITVSAVDFLAESDQLEPVPPIGMGEVLLRQTGTMVHAATILVVALLVIWFGLRPATRAILAHPRPPAHVPEVPAEQQPGEFDSGPAIERRLAGAPEANLIEDLTSKLNRSPQKRLEQIIQFDEEHAATVLKQWIHQGNAA
jgi:flagellar M-ring protein FliF